jgi:hypothetical protein
MSTTIQAGSGLYQKGNTFHIHVDSAYLAVDPYRDAVTAGPNGLACLRGGNQFSEGTNTFEDIVCNSIDVVSDSRTKQRIVPYDPPKAKFNDAIMAMQVCKFRYNGQNRERVGMVAQNFQKCIADIGCPSSTTTTEGGKSTIDYILVVNLLLYQVQQLTTRIGQLEDVLKEKHVDTERGDANRVDTPRHARSHAA